MKKKRYVQVGTGGRGLFFLEAMHKEWKDNCELVALCDSNPGHMEYYNQVIVNELGGRALPTYSDRQFRKMLQTHRPDTVLVTTRDCWHDKYIVSAMEFGCDAITEKPMTTDEKKCRRILAAVKKTGRDLRVTFNYRYSPTRTQVKELLMSGVIGRILSVDFQWVLNNGHGADYFRRWHREKKNSGGLLVHKATHHFDLVNWWISARPVEVFAMGGLHFYGNGSGMAEKYGLARHSDRCLDCQYNRSCRYSLWLRKGPIMSNFYLANEKHDGYHRDRCVFGSGIDIEDIMQVQVRYDSGALLSYSLNAFSPWEGYRIAFNGTLGRLEHDCVENIYVSGDGTVPGTTIAKGTKIRLFPHFKPPTELEPRFGEGGHGGGDPLLLEDLFSRKRKADPCQRAAGFAEGALSIMIGIAANRSIRTGKKVRINSLIDNLPAT